MTMDGWVRDICCTDRGKIGHGAALYVAGGSADVIHITPKGRLDLSTRRYGLNQDDRYTLFFVNFLTHFWKLTLVGCSRNWIGLLRKHQTGRVVDLAAIKNFMIEESP